jgi:hypothetical protein
MVVVAIAVLAGAVLLAMLALQAALHVDAARDARMREDGCAFEDPEEHTTPLAWCALVLGEVGATLCVGLVALLPRRPPSRDDGRRSVVLVAGWAMPASATALLARRLRGAGWARVYPIGLGVWPSIDEATRRLAGGLATLRATHAVGDVDVIAVGLSGIAARALLDRGVRVRRVVTLGTPHQGTLTAPWMRRGPWARDVRPDDDAAAPTCDGDGIAIASAHDVLLVPPALAYWPGAFNVALRGVGHVGMLCSARVWAIVEENLAHTPAVTGRSHVG